MPIHYVVYLPNRDTRQKDRWKTSISVQLQTSGVTFPSQAEVGSMNSRIPSLATCSLLALTGTATSRTRFRN